VSNVAVQFAREESLCRLAPVAAPHRPHHFSPPHQASYCVQAGRLCAPACSRTLRFFSSAVYRVADTLASHSPQIGNAPSHDQKHSARSMRCVTPATNLLCFSELPRSQTRSCASTCRRSCSCAVALCSAVTCAELGRSWRLTAQRSCGADALCSCVRHLRQRPRWPVQPFRLRVPLPPAASPCCRPAVAERGRLRLLPTFAAEQHTGPRAKRRCALHLCCASACVLCQRLLRAVEISMHAVHCCTLCTGGTGQDLVAPAHPVRPLRPPRRLAAAAPAVEDGAAR